MPSRPVRASGAGHWRADAAGRWDERTCSHPPRRPTVEPAGTGGKPIDKPHVLWVEIGFGIAVAVFALLIVIGREAGTATFAVLMLAYLVAFIAFTVAAEAAAVRTEKWLPEPAPRRSGTPSYRSTATGA